MWEWIRFTVLTNWPHGCLQRSLILPEVKINTEGKTIKLVESLGFVVSFLSQGNERIRLTKPTAEPTFLNTVYIYMLY